MNAAGLTLAERMRLGAGALRAKVGRRLDRWFRAANPEALRWRAEGLKRRSAFYQDVWCRAAATTGAEATPYDGGMIELRRGSRRTWVNCNYTALDDPATQRLAEDKPLVQRLLRDAGVPVPEFRRFTSNDLRPALEFLASTGHACVLKPAHGTGAGQGVVTQIRTRRELLDAIPTAAAFGPRLMLEEQIAGGVYRLVFLDGQLLDATRRSPPTVTGDGTRSIRQLVIAANEERIAGGMELSQTGLHFDHEMRATLRTAGRSLASVPAAGETVVVKTVVNENCARENAAALPSLGADVIDVATTTAQTLGIRLVGIDVITTDPGLPLAQTGGVILEANTGPGLHYHYHREGPSFAMAEHLLEAIWK